MAQPRKTAFYALTASISIGIIYSIIFNTYLDTSDPIISSLPHPLHNQSYFANKSNIFNSYFVKKAWAWTSAVYFSLFFTSPTVVRTRKRVVQYLIATAVWAVFTTWFFGPAIFDRIVTYSGGQCVVILPAPSNDISPPSYLNVPTEFCYTRTRLSPHTHPELFTTPFTLPHPTWSAKPRHQSGHDVSGHIFLLTISVLFLADQLRPTLQMYANQRMAAYVPFIHWIAMYFGFAISALWLWMTFMTSVYWHTPFEKLSGFALGLIGYLVTRLSEYF